MKHYRMSIEDFLERLEALQEAGSYRCLGEYHYQLAVLYREGAVFECDSKDPCQSIAEPAKFDRHLAKAVKYGSAKAQHLFAVQMKKIHSIRTLALYTLAALQNHQASLDKIKELNPVLHGYLPELKLALITKDLIRNHLFVLEDRKGRYKEQMFYHIDKIILAVCSLMTMYHYFQRKKFYDFEQMDKRKDFAMILRLVNDTHAEELTEKIKQLKENTKANFLRLKVGFYKGSQVYKDLRDVCLNHFEDTHPELLKLANSVVLTFLENEKKRNQEVAKDVIRYLTKSAPSLFVIARLR